MTTNKGDIIVSSQPRPECCMCGDCGLSHELFQCKVCQFRSQHRYCSNLYPKAESYQVCNWCLRHENKEKSQNSSNSSSSNKNNVTSEGDSKKSKNRGRNGSSDSDNQGGGYLRSQRGNLQVNNNNSPIIKKQNAVPVRSICTRRRLITQGRLEEKLRRTRSDEISNNNNNNNNNYNNNNGITKQVFRNKVRRYKLLEEVSS